MRPRINIKPIGNQNDVDMPSKVFFISQTMNVIIDMIKPKQKPLTNNPTYCRRALMRPNSVAIEHETPINCVWLIVGCVERIM
jgi:hypothetical protein